MAEPSWAEAPQPSDEMLARAKKAVEAIEERKGEDVDEWAHRLAEDVKHATD